MRTILSIEMRTIFSSATRFLAAGAMCLAAGLASAVDMAGDTNGWSSGSDQRQAHRIGNDFVAFAGSRENAEALALGLRRGSEITLISGDGSKTTFTPSTGHMGHGNVSKAMALAQRQLARAGIRHPTPEQIETALNGGTVTGRHGKTVEMQGILQLRSQGMGWGKIAHTVGVKPGQGFKPLPIDRVGGRYGHGHHSSPGMVDGHGSRAGLHGGRHGAYHDDVRKPVENRDGMHRHRGGHPSGVVTAAGGSPVRDGKVGWHKGGGGEVVHRHGGRPVGAGIVTAAGTPGAQAGATRVKKGGGGHHGGGRHVSMGSGIVNASGGAAMAASSGVRSAGGGKIGHGRGRGRVGKD